MTSDWQEALEILHPGPQTTVQDLGRFGHLRDGVPVSGAFDFLAHRIANLTVGNPVLCATLEIALSRFAVRALGPIWVALAGRGLRLRRNGTEADASRALRLGNGDILEVAGSGTGARGYLAVRGGFAVSPVLGSRSTFLPAGFGGYRGRALRAADRLHAFRAETEVPAPSEGVAKLRAEHAFAELGTLEYLSIGTRASLDSLIWRVSSVSNRIGLRLEPVTGARLSGRFSGSIPSTAVVPGAIQVPPDGAPVILGADAQTVGGYPLLGAVIHADLWKLGQLAGGATVRLRATSRANAVARSQALAFAPRRLS